MADEYIRKADAIKQCGFGMTSLHIADNLRKMPPVDVVQVVRCENCVHWSYSNRCERPELAGNRWHDDKYFETLPDDFCSYGERKEE